MRLRSCDLQVRIGLLKPITLELKLKNSKFPVLMRTHRSDRDVLWQIFIQGQYEPVRLSDPKTILDLGANVGYASAYFLSKYPTATVVAVEPDPDNYSICCRNLAPYGQRAKPVHGAAWPESAKLLLDKGTYGDGRDWATRVKSAGKEVLRDGDSQIHGYDVVTLMSFFESDEVDLVKIDIERCELELFSRNTESWLPRVRNLCIELHDKDCNDAFFRAVANYSYDLSQAGDLTICNSLREQKGTLVARRIQPM